MGSGYIPLIDEYARPLKGHTSVGETRKDDQRIDFTGYGYIIEGFNVKCCGKVPYTLTFYSPEGYSAADEDGNLKKGGAEEWNHPYNQPGMAV
jgi:hypothetical protein